MKGINILWVSRHPPKDEQKIELEEVFGHVHFIQISKTIKDGWEVTDLKEKYETEEVVAVLPIQIMAQLTRMGIEPIRAIMDRNVKENGDVEFVHERFERIEKVEIITSSLLGD